MLGTIYWVSVFLVIMAIFCIALGIKLFKRNADLADKACLGVCVVVFTAFFIPLCFMLSSMHTPVKVIITDMDGKVTVYETERGYIDDDKEYWRIYDKDSDDWVEHHNFKSAQIEYLDN